ncbi:MAG: hypothetical protein Kow0088_24280 [Anaerolineales bacterium]
MNQAAELEFALQDCLESMLNDGKTIDEAISRYPHLRQELFPLLESALWVRAQREEFSLSPKRKVVLRQRVLQRIQVMPLSSVKKPARSTPHHTSWSMKRPLWAWSAIVLLLICFFVFTTSGVALASQNSLPGENLYVVKTALEEARLMVTWDAGQRASLRLEYAQRRLDEATRLSQQGRFEEVPLALDSYQVQLYLALEETKHAARNQPQQTQQLKAEIETRLQAQIQAIAILENLLPPAQAQLAQAAQNASQRTLQSATSLFAETAATATPTAPMPALASATQAGGEVVPPGLLRKTQSPTPPASLTPRPTNTHRPTQAIQPSKTPKPTQVRPPTKTPKPTNPNKPTSKAPPGQTKPSKTPKK